MFNVDEKSFTYFKKKSPEWVRLGSYMNWLFRNHVKKCPGISGTFALKIHSTNDGIFLSADFWCAPLSKGYCVSVIGTDELDVWVRSVKQVESLRLEAVQRQKSQTSKAPKVKHGKRKPV